METTFPFRLRGFEGSVRVSYGVNEDPKRWGYDLLRLTFDLDVARGFPVLEAAVAYPAEGYGAFLGWIQVVRYQVAGETEAVTIVDVPPQMKDAGVPYAAFGVRPTLFDAPAFTVPNVVWRASSFLVHTPDALMTPVVEPVCGYGVTWWRMDRPFQANSWARLRKTGRSYSPCYAPTTRTGRFASSRSYRVRPSTRSRSSFARVRRVSSQNSTAMQP